MNKRLVALATVPLLALPALPATAAPQPSLYPTRTTCVPGEKLCFAMPSTWTARTSTGDLPLTMSSRWTRNIVSVESPELWEDLCMPGTDISYHYTVVQARRTAAVSSRNQPLYAVRVVMSAPRGYTARVFLTEHRTLSTVGRKAACVGAAGEWYYGRTRDWFFVGAKPSPWRSSYAAARRDADSGVNTTAFGVISTARYGR